MAEANEDLTEYPDAIDDENRHRAPDVGQPGTEDQDLFAWNRTIQQMFPPGPIEETRNNG